MRRADQNEQKGGGPPTEPDAAPSGRWCRIRHALVLTIGYFRSRERGAALALLCVTIGLRLALTAVALSVNRWEKLFFDALADRRADALPSLVLLFALFGLLTVAIAAGDVFFQELFAVRWRRWLTSDRMDRWFADDRYLDIEHTAMLDNPDQRIADDIRFFTTNMVQLIASLAGVVSSMIGFGAVLWRITSRSGAGGGDLFWFAVLYALVGSWLVLFFARPLVRRSMAQERCEADFRFRLVTARRSGGRAGMAEDTAGLAARAGERLGALVRNTVSLMKIRSGLQGFTSMFSLIQGVIPLALVVNRYFAGVMSLGDVMQARGAFVAFAVALAWFVQNFAKIGATAASANRILALDKAVAQL